MTLNRRELLQGIGALGLTASFPVFDSFADLSVETPSSELLRKFQIAANNTGHRLIYFDGKHGIATQDVYSAQNQNNLALKCPFSYGSHDNLVYLSPNGQKDILWLGSMQKSTRDKIKEKGAYTIHTADGMNIVGQNNKVIKEKGSVEKILTDAAKEVGSDLLIFPKKLDTLFIYSFDFKQVPLDYLKKLWSPTFSFCYDYFKTK